MTDGITAKIDRHVGYFDGQAQGTTGGPAAIAKINAKSVGLDILETALPVVGPVLKGIYTPEQSSWGSSNELDIQEKSLLAAFADAFGVAGAAVLLGASVAIPAAAPVLVPLAAAAVAPVRIHGAYSAAKNVVDSVYWGARAVFSDPSEPYPILRSGDFFVPRKIR